MSDDDRGPTFCGDPPAAAVDSDFPDRRELALVAVERTRMPMVVTDPRRPDNPIILANQAFIDLTGYTSDEVIGRNCRFLQGPDTSEIEVEQLRNALASGEDSISAELVNYRKNGSSFVNALRISAVRNEQGELLYQFGSQEDVTTEREARRLAASEHRLMMEVDHRTMNALALVQSIVRLSRAKDMQSLSRSISRRVEALSKTHRLLAERRWRSVDLADLVATQICSLAPNGRVIAKGEAAELHPRVVQPFGLVIHELLSNAQVHGAFSNDQGRVFVQWGINEGALVFEWQEELLEGNVAYLLEGFGLQIVRTVVEQQLGGKPQIETGNGILSATIVVPDAIVTIG